MLVLEDGQLYLACDNCGIYKRAKDGLCVFCQLQLDSLRLDDDSIALFRYSGIARDLVIATKVKGNLKALRTLCAIFISAIKTQQWVQSRPVVMACPSSLWGRWRGRLDIADCLTRQVATSFRLGYQRAPRHLFWSMTKQALLDKRSLLDPLSCEGSDYDLLLIDDVVTSGETIARVVRTLPEGVRVRPLCWALSTPA